MPLTVSAGIAEAGFAGRDGRVCRQGQAGEVWQVSTQSCQHEGSFAAAMHLAHNHHISPRRSHVSFSPTNSQCFVLMKPVLGTQRSQDALAHPASPATAPGTWALPEQAEAACLGKALSCRAVTCCLSPAGCVVKVTSSVWESL